MKLLGTLFLIVSCSFINVAVICQQNETLRGSYDSNRQRSISDDRERNMQFAPVGRSRSASVPASTRKMIIEEVTNDTPYTLVFIDKHNLVNSDQGVIQRMRPQSECQCNYEIIDSRDTPREYDSYGALKRDKLMHDAQFEIALFDDSDKRLEGRSNYFNFAVVQDAIKIRKSHPLFRDRELEPLTIDLNRCKDCDCDPNRFVFENCDYCAQSFENITKNKPAVFTFILKMSEKNRNLKTGIIDLDFVCQVK